MSLNTNITVKLRNVRLSFPNLFTARTLPGAAPGSTPKFGASFLLNKKTHATQIAEIERAVDLLMKEKKWAKATVKSVPMVEASSKINSKTGEPYDGYDENTFSINANHTKKPLVVDLAGSPLVESDGKPYGGCYVNANVDIYAYDKDPLHGRRICCSLRSVQFVKDGQAFGGGAAINAENEFSDVSANADEDVM